MRAGMLRLALCLISLLLIVPTRAETGWKERDYQRLLCAGMQLEVRLGKYGRADCVSDTHAIEVEWADKFKEGVGQALIYSTAAHLIPGLILICRGDEASCLNASLASQETFTAFGIQATVWECDLGSRVISDCAERNIAPRP